MLVYTRSPVFSPFSAHFYPPPPPPIKGSIDAKKVEVKLVKAYRLESHYNIHYNYDDEGQ